MHHSKILKILIQLNEKLQDRVHKNSFHCQINYVICSIVSINHSTIRIAAGGLFMLWEVWGDYVWCIPLHSWAKHLTLTVSLPTQIYKWEAAKLNAWNGGCPCEGLSIPFRKGIEMLLVAWLYRNLGKLQQYAWITCPHTYLVFLSFYFTEMKATNHIQYL